MQLSNYNKMKKIVVFLFCIFQLYSLIGQTGPGGVGNSTNIKAWLDASSLGLSNATSVSSWTDISGNSNAANQLTPANQPTFFTNQINGLPAISFDGIDDFFDFSSNITAGNVTIFAVYLSTKTSMGSLLTTQKHSLRTENNKVSARYVSPNNLYRRLKINGTFSVFSLQTDAGLTSGFLNLRDGNGLNTFTRTSLSTATTSSIGKESTLFLDGQIAEIIIFDQIINSAKRKIVGSHLATKYNLTAEQNLYAFRSTNSNQVIGIGQEADGNQTVARGLDSLQISNPSSLDNGDYLLVGNDGAGFGTSTINIPGSVVERWNQTWRVDKTGTPGSVDLEFFLGSNNFATNTDYVLLIENVDGNFGNGGTFLDLAIPSYDAVNNSITFSNVNLVDGSYFTLAETSGEITSIANGNWNSPGTWSCGCIPGSGELVNIESPFNVVVNVNSSVGNLIIKTGSSLTFSGNSTLSTDGDVVIQAPTTFNDGTIAFTGSASSQSVTNSSGSTISFNNLSSSNPNGLNILTGDWSLSGSLQITAGGMDVSGANSFTLTSDATSTSQILPSMSGAFIGDFTVQRHISARNANFANFSSPIQSATVADLDDDLILSGVGGANGNAIANGGGIFRSVQTYDFRNDVHVILPSLTEPLVVGQGYEVYLASTASSFNGGTVDFVGVPNSGNSFPTARIDQGWNLLGNPFHSFIEYDSIKTSVWIPDNYYIFNTDAGSYSFFDGPGKPPIAPSQGFWIFKIPGGNKGVDFKESGKVSSTSSAFLRKKRNNRFELHINNDKNSFTHKAEFNFDVNSTSRIDENDAFFLTSPLETAPAIYTISSNSSEGLVLNSLDPLEISQKIPVEIYAGVEGNFSIKAENLEKIYENYSCVYLQDKHEGKTIDLSVDESYSFFSKKGTDQRFNLILSNNFEDCEDLIQMKGVTQTLKHGLELRNSNGIWHLDYTLDEEQNRLEVKVYSMNGALVINPISFSASGSGTWPLQELNSLHGIYLIQVISNDEILNKTIKL